MKEKDIVDIDQESSIKYKDKTMFNSVQTGKSKDVLVNTDIPSRPASYPLSQVIRPLPPANDHFFCDW